MFKKFLIYVLATVLIMSPMFVFAQQTVDLSDLTEKQQAEILMEVAKKKTPEKSATIEDVGQYADLGQQYGKAIAATAKELGIAVNDFLDSPAGMLAAVLIVWKVMGDTILGIVAGSIWFMTMIPLWIFYFNKMVLQMTRKEYETTDGKIVREPIDWGEQAGGLAAIFALIMFFVCIAGFIIIF